MTSCAFFTCALVLALPLTPTWAFDSDIMSDITTSSTDETRALEIKASQFWEPVNKAAEDASTRLHSALYADTEEALARLPAENSYVRKALSEALSALRRADKDVSTQGSQASETAAEGLAAGGRWESVFNFMTGGQDYFSGAIRRFVGGEYSDRLKEQVNKRQGHVLPALRGTQSVTRNVLKDTRLASERSFDVLKYDVYNKNVPKTPAFVKPIVDRLIDAARDTQSSFLKLTLETTTSLTKDTEGKEDHPSATVTKSLIQGIGNLQPAGAGAGAGLQSSGALIIESGTEAGIGFSVLASSSTEVSGSDNIIVAL